MQTLTGCARDLGQGSTDLGGLGIVPQILVQAQRLSEKTAGQPEVTGIPVGVAEALQGGSLTGAVFDAAPDGQRILQAGNGLIYLVHAEVSVAEVAERVGFGIQVAKIAEDGQRQLEMRD